jgi:23S rRNA (guanosine2251-2'-O)-methyltransferase
MKKQHIYGLHTVTVILKNTPEKVLNIYVQKDRHDRKIQHILKLAEQHALKPQLISRKKLDQLLPECRHQGVIAIVKNSMKYHEANLEDLLDNLTEPPFLLILDGVQDPHNLGACLRSANAAGVHAVIAPKDNAVGITPIVCKVACGAAEMMPFIPVTNLARTMRMLKDNGVWLYGAEAESEVSIYERNLTGPIGIVLGAEGKGLRRLTREHCDELMSIPMHGTVASLNVSVATGICLFEAIRQRLCG